ncbi:cobalamin biosynthesis protein [Parvibium lacunae]|uniref:Cobalamin biosynthesis protein CobD n=1 Tax=Parvibium lacunae TaxID=1888893 RepID=A0A368L495_9BURK|nr:cobalamin biosynthesis protein [Parvibium lacunae]RCS58406.1 hypothetical protein DU000_06215 [Parvibium lacunae]
MSFLVLILAFVIEQWHPLRPDSRGNWIYRGVEWLAHWLEEHMDIGLMRHGRVAWWWFMLGILIPTYSLYLLAEWLWAPLAWAWTLAVLYFTLGFRQFSHRYSAIQTALTAGDLDTARQQLQSWLVQLERPLSDWEMLSANEISRHALREALLASHRHVLGVMLCFLLLPGPIGPVLYRLAEFLARRWNTRAHMTKLDPHAPLVQPSQFGRFAAHAFEWIDWLPARSSAFTFAIVGNFEDALYCWKSQAARYAETLFPRSGQVTPPTVYSNAHAGGILLAAGAGAMGLELASDSGQLLKAEAGETLIGEADSPPEPVWRGATPTVYSLRTGVGLVWRAVVMWLCLLGLLSLAHLLS